MYPFDRHERLRRNVSAYADGELSSRDAARVEAHLASCEDCRALLDGLRMATSALAGLAAAEAPRSFALTPDMVGVPSRELTRRPAPAYNNGLRLAAAGLAVALAVVIVTDRADLGGEGDSQESQVQGLDERSSDTLGAATENALADAPSAGAAGATGVPAESAAEPLDETQARASTAPEFAAGDTDSTNNPETESESEDTAGAADRDAAGSGGVDALTIVEIVLGALLAATLIGLTFVWIARRRRSV